MKIMTTDIGQVLRLTGDEMVKIRLSADRVLYVVMKGDETTLFVSPEADDGAPHDAPVVATLGTNRTFPTQIDFEDLVKQAVGPGEFTFIQPGYQARLDSILAGDQGTVTAHAINCSFLGE